MKYEMLMSSQSRSLRAHTAHRWLPPGRGVPLKLGGVHVRRDREEEELTLASRHLPVEQAVSAAACTQLPSTGKERAAGVRGSCLHFEQHAQKPKQKSF